MGEVTAEFKQPALLFSGGKDSSAVMADAHRAVDHV
jgi:3'-phosphoadenosine 5'-phosphosulfate sulfotransferase (PAPS reductase)/FAD synthetase